MRLGPRDQRPGDQPVWLRFGTSTRASLHGSDRIDRVKMEDVQVDGAQRTWRPAGRGQR
jgi:hypothetical protein